MSQRRVFALRGLRAATLAGAGGAIGKGVGALAGTLSKLGGEAGETAAAEGNAGDEFGPLGWLAAATTGAAVGFFSADDAQAYEAYELNQQTAQNDLRIQQMEQQLQEQQELQRGTGLGDGESIDAQGNVRDKNGNLVRDKHGRDAGAKKPCPSKAKAVANNAHKTGKPFAGYVGGRPFANDGRSGGQILPQVDAQGNPITYQEWDVNPYQPGVNRGPERVVTGSDGSSYYTDDHYSTFKPIQ